MKQKGFTLIELLVAMIIFAIVVTTVITIFVRGTTSQRRVFALQEIQENARFMIEKIAKEIRMSEISSGSGEPSAIDIIHPVNDNVNYSFSAGQILRNGAAINSNEVTVTGKFSIDKTYQPRVTISMEVKSSSQPENKINLQTTLSSRKY